MDAPARPRSPQKRPGEWLQQQFLILDRRRARADQDLRSARRDPRRGSAEVADELERPADDAKPFGVLVEFDRVRVACRQLCPDAKQVGGERRDRRIRVPRQLRVLEGLLGLRIWNLLTELRKRRELAPPPLAGRDSDL